MATRSDKSITITDSPDISRTITRYQNLDDNEIMITESKLENILLKHSEALKAGSDWKTPLGLIIAVVATFLTAEFNKDFLGLESSVWQAVFIICLCSSFFWLCKSIYLRYIHRDRDLSDLIRSIKNEGETSQENQAIDLCIINATYGIDEDGKKVDVTDKLNDLIENNRLTTSATNALVGADPAPGIIKQLEIEYKQNGVPLSKTFAEGDTVILPENPA